MRVLEKRLERLPYWLRLGLTVLVLATLTGLGGILIHELLNLVETLAFGHSEEDVAFLTDGTSWFRRFLALITIGLLSSWVWYLLQKRQPIFSIKKEIGDASSRLASLRYFLRQLLHIFWQIIAVGAGSPVGKEGAPRELGALLASPVARLFLIRRNDRAVLIACGAGGGLAAVYQVPLTSAFFVFETLGLTWSLRNFILVILSTYISAYVARIDIAAEALYQVTGVSWQVMDLRYALILLLVLVPVAIVFSRLSKWVGSHRIKDKRILWSLPLVFLLLALLAISWPLLLGNGRMMAQTVLDGVTWQEVAGLFVLKALVVLLTLLAGAYGGTLTPSFALGLAGASLLLTFLPADLVGSGSEVLLLGVVVFLTVTLKAPISAAGLVFGFTGQGLEAMPYLLITAWLAFGFMKLLEKAERVRESKKENV